MFAATNWKDFEVLDASGGERLERWGSHILVRPDPQVIWNTPKSHPGWSRYDARYIRSSTGGGRWENRGLPAEWRAGYGELSFVVRPTGFKHTGLFPEQAANWDFLQRTIREAGRPLSVLNLFGYTGAATMACAAAGASVCHVDAAKGMVSWARENAAACGLSEAPIRYIVEDCKRFVEREIRRGRRYDGILMDPPSFGRGPDGELWKIEEHLYPLLQLCADALSDNPAFFLISSYTTGLAPSVMGYLLGVTVGQRYGGRVEADELGLPVTASGQTLPCGASARWTAADRRNKQ